MTKDWCDAERGVISIPPYEPCNCGWCSTLAEQYADRHDLDYEEEFEKYWRAKDDGDRDVYIPTERDRRIIELYFKDVPYSTISYSTAARRLKKAAELTDGIRPDRTYYHMMRATAATHLLWKGMAPPAVDVQFGWADEKTKEKYAQKTALRTKQEFDQLFNREGESPLTIRDDPATCRELRPTDPDERIVVETWTPDTDVDPHPRGRDLEDALLSDLKEEDGSGDPPMAVTPTGAAVSLAVKGGDGLQRRARAEERRNGPKSELVDPTPQHAVTIATVALLPALALVSAFALGDGAIAATGMLLGAGYSIQDIDL